MSRGDLKNRQEEFSRALAELEHQKTHLPVVQSQVRDVTKEVSLQSSLISVNSTGVIHIIENTFPVTFKRTDLTNSVLGTTMTVNSARDEWVG